MASARKVDCGFRGKADANTKGSSIGPDTISGPVLERTGAKRADVPFQKGRGRGERLEISGTAGDFAGERKEDGARCVTDGRPLIRIGLHEAIIERAVERVRRRS